MNKKSKEYFVKDHLLACNYIPSKDFSVLEQKMNTALK